MIFSSLSLKFATFRNIYDTIFSLNTRFFTHLLFKHFTEKGKIYSPKFFHNSFSQQKNKFKNQARKSLTQLVFLFFTKLFSVLNSLQGYPITTEEYLYMNSRFILDVLVVGNRSWCECMFRQLVEAFYAWRHAQKRR